MATILFTWELGAGIGHLMTISPLAKPLAAKGHRVVLAAKNLAAAEQIFSDGSVQCVQAPQKGTVTWKRFEPIYSLAHLLHNIGFGDDAQLAAATAEWKRLYEQISPDLIVFDHSPTALLAARGERARRALLGSGFMIPPDVTLFPNLRAFLQIGEQQLRDDEDSVLQRVNSLLRSRGEPALDRLAQLFTQVDEIFLTVYPQLDHYPNRGTARYYGSINGGDAGGIAPIWPDVAGKKIYVYARDCAGLPPLLAATQKIGLPALIYADGIDPRLQQQFASPSMRFEMKRLNMQQAANACDLAITTATMGTTAMMLRAGKPLLLLPQTLEQGIISRRVKELGAAIVILPGQSAMIEQSIRALLDDSQYTLAARRAAEKFSELDLTQMQQEMLRKTEGLL